MIYLLIYLFRHGTRK